MTGTPQTLLPLPRNLNPPLDLCITINLPNDAEYFSAFMGALIPLSQWLFWDRDDAHSGATVARVWRHVLNSIQICEGTIPTFELGDDMPLFRQNGCLLQAQCPDGSWDTIYDPTTCIQDLAKATASNPSGVTNPQAGQCYTYPVVMSGRDIWYSPVPLQDGDTIAFTAFAGAWNDGTSAWYCPDGTPYVLNLCIGVRGHLGGDPSGSLYHAQLAGFLSSTVIDPFAGTTTISGTSAPTQLVLQMNDADVTNNNGSISFTVTICKASVAAGTWERIIDLTATNGGFSAANPNEGTWVSGQGWVPGDEFDGMNWARHLQLTKTFTSCMLTYLEMDYVVSRGAEIVPLDDEMKVNGSIVQTHSNASGTLAMIDTAGNSAAVSIGFNSYISQQSSSGALSGSETLYRVVMRGIGAPPF